VEAGAARRALARSERMPDVTAGLRAGREEGDDIVGLGLTIPIPLFDRNQGAVAEADAELAGARAELAVTDLAVRREVAAARARLVAALEALEAAESLGLAALEDGLELVERSFDAGKIGSAEVILFRRELVEARRQSVEARVEAFRAAVDLAVVTGEALPGTEWLDIAETEP
ncbi:MAG: TolC family protein, partial [Thermoanaerobaculia bacterium]